jgi:hypothetical protein
MYNYCKWILRCERYAATISEDVGSVLTWIFDTNLPNYTITTTESLNQVWAYKIFFWR